MNSPQCLRAIGLVALHPKSQYYNINELILIFKSISYVNVIILEDGATAPYSGTTFTTRCASYVRPDSKSLKLTSTVIGCDSGELLASFHGTEIV